MVEYDSQRFKNPILVNAKTAEKTENMLKNGA